MSDKKEGVSKNVLAILLIFAIIISALGTYMAVYNANNAESVTGGSTTSYQGSNSAEVGVYVTNPETTNNEGG